MEYVFAHVLIHFMETQNFPGIWFPENCICPILLLCFAAAVEKMMRQHMERRDRDGLVPRWH